ncbi:MAG: AraC family transcriptional regulator [Planctomycetes bacterium]|nr:AraC family transcriptional regulator [Planctomycetota bacterium]
MKYFESIIANGASCFEGRRGIDVRQVPHHAIKLIEEGRGFFCRRGEELRRVTAPTIFWQRPGVVYEWGPDEDGWRVSYAKFSGRRAGELLRDGFDCISAEGFVQMESLEPVGTLMKNIEELYRHHFADESARLLILLEQILLALGQERGGADNSGVLQKRFAPLLKQLASSPQKDYDFYEEARKTGLSYSHFRRLFREQTGVPPQEYLIRCRVRAVEQGLVYTDEPVKKIIAQAGYNDIGHFGRLFRKRTGMSPGRYRQEHRGA